MNNEKTFLKKLEHITLRDDARASMRKHLSAYADLHVSTASVFDSEETSPSFAFLFSKRFSLYAGALSLILISSAAVSSAAERSAPGDSLYGIKIHVNEPVLSAFSAGDVGSARFSAKLATRRADEVVTLATKGELTEEKAAYLDTAFSENIKNAVEKSDALEQKGNVSDAKDVRANLAVSLAGEAQALGAVTLTPAAQTRGLLHKIVASSQSIGGDESGDQGDTHTMSAGEPRGGTVIARGVVSKMSGKDRATTTPATNSEAAALAAENKDHKEGVRPLFVTASTTLRALNTTSGLALPKTDAAIHFAPKHENKNEGELEVQTPGL